MKMKKQKTGIYSFGIPPKKLRPPLEFLKNSNFDESKVKKYRFLI